MKTGLLFPGQGAQSVGMGFELCQRSATAKALFDEASEILGFDILQLCRNGPAEQLNRTEFGQPALFVHSFAAMKQLEIEQPELWQSVDCVAGLSLGEYTAVGVAGGFTFAEGVALVHARGKAMQDAADAVPSGMSSIIGFERDKLEQVCEQATDDSHFVKIANLLCPGNIAISGHLEALDRADKASETAGAMKAVRLQVAGAFHTSIMQPAVQRLEEALSAITLKPTRVNLYSNVDACPHSDPTEISNLLSRQVVAPVLWEDSLRQMIDSGIEKFIEIGNGRVLAGTLKRINRKMACENFGN